MAKEHHHLRKKLLINPAFQLSFLKYILGIAAFTLAVFYGGKLLFFQEVRAYMISTGIPADHLAFDFLKQQSRRMDWIFLGASLLELAFLGYIGLKLSHRVAGPLHRLRQHLLRAATGAPMDELRFRKGDYFQEVADAYNANHGKSPTSPSS